MQGKSYAAVPSQRREDTVSEEGAMFTIIHTKRLKSITQVAKRASASYVRMVIDYQRLYSAFVKLGSELNASNKKRDSERIKVEELTAKVERLQAEGHWIPEAQELPFFDRHLVLYYQSDSTYYIGYRVDDTWYTDYGKEIDPPDLYFSLPLPEAK
jgi:hypothetical protein